jgi:hypothetical protein
MEMEIREVHLHDIFSSKSVPFFYSNHFFRRLWLGYYLWCCHRISEGRPQDIARPLIEVRVGLPAELFTTTYFFFSSSSTSEGGKACTGFESGSSSESESLEKGYEMSNTIVLGLPASTGGT